ncbi:MAG: hypothetical protein ACJ8D6_03895 [Sphingomicrobium sp.]
MNRWAALLLAIVGGAASALAVVAGLTVAAVGILWLFVFGDDPWPAWFEPAANAAIPLVGLLLWAGFASAIWRLLKRD